MAEDRISSGESEGAFDEFIADQLDELIENIVNDSNLDSLGGRGSDVVVEMDDITVPTFVYDDQNRGSMGVGPVSPGSDSGKIRFNLPFLKLMERIAHLLRLPNLTKEGKGRIKEVSYEFKTFATDGVLIDKKRTFKHALKTSIGTGVYAPDHNRYEIQVARRDRRFKVPERVEKPKFKAVVFYMGDISYSTYGERLELEKRVVYFIQNWIDYNYGIQNVEHRFFVHDAQAYEVQEDEFYNVSNIGGTRASMVFDLVHQVAFNEYDTRATNFYAFYFGDGELFDDDAQEIVSIIGDSLYPLCNRIGVVEVQPGRLSLLNRQIATRFSQDRIVRLGEINNTSETIEVIKTLFGDRK